MVTSRVAAGAPDGGERAARGQAQTLNADGNPTLAVVDSRPHQGAPAVASSSAPGPVVGVPSADRGRVRAS